MPSFRVFVASAVAVYALAASAGEVSVQGNRLVRSGEEFRLRGANYYPKDAAWHRFWLEYAAHSAQIDTELDKAACLGVNTLRIFLIFDLFADGSSPHFASLEDFLDRLASRRLGALITLFDFYVDSDYPYCDSAGACDYAASREHVDAVLGAVGDHPAVFGWDLKNEMDRDYALFTAEKVKDWAREMAPYLRERTDRFVTLGFSGATPANTFDPDLVAEFACDVDVVSFHWFLPEGDFQAAVEALADRVLDEPCPERSILLEEFGLHTRDCPPAASCFDPHTEAHQAAYYNALLSLAGAAQLAGTMFWTLTDFSYILPGARDTEHCLGILRNSESWEECIVTASSPCTCEVVDPPDYSEKPAVEIVLGHWQDLLYLDLFEGWVDQSAIPPPGWEDNYADEQGMLLGGARLCGYRPGHPLCSYTPGHAALSKYVAPDGTSLVGWARSPLLRQVDLERFPFLSGRIANYSIKDPVNGSDAVLHVGVQEEGSPTTRLLTVTPGDTLPLDFDLDLRPVLTGAPSFRIVLELEKVPGDNGYSASYELDFVALRSLLSKIASRKNSYSGAEGRAGWQHPELLGCRRGRGADRL